MVSSRNESDKKGKDNVVIHPKLGYTEVLYQPLTVTFENLKNSRYSTENRAVAILSWGCSYKAGLTKLNIIPAFASAMSGIWSG